jgi:ribosome-associated heat shock protein Hsp15
MKTPRDGGGPSPPEASADVRLDVWLDVSCLFKTRSAAQAACRGGKVEVNGQSAKPHRVLHVGDELRITRTAGLRQRVIVKALAEHHLPKARARMMFDDVTPPPTPEELAVRELERHFWTARRPAPTRAPDRREKRRIRQEKEGGG